MNVILPQCVQVSDMLFFNATMVHRDHIAYLLIDHVRANLLDLYVVQNFHLDHHNFPYQQVFK